MPRRVAACLTSVVLGLGACAASRDAGTVTSAEPTRTPTAGATATTRTTTKTRSRPTSVAPSTTRRTGGTPVPSPHPRTPSELVGPAIVELRRVTLGPSTTPTSPVDDLPVSYLSADGWLFHAGKPDAGGVATTSARHLDARAIAALRALIRTAGLDERPAAQPAPERATPADEVTYRDDVSGLLSVNRIVSPSSAARAVLDALADPEGAFPGLVGPEVRYGPAALRLQAARDASIGTAPAWPVPGLALVTASACAALRGADAATLLRAMRMRPGDASTTTGGAVTMAWRDRGNGYRVAVRPLLPGEPDCPALRPSARPS